MTIMDDLRFIMENSYSGTFLRILLCSVYLWSGITKLIDFQGTAAHFARRFQLPFPRAAAAITILSQLVGSALVITTWLPSVGAIVLVAFTMVATTIAYPFWRMSGVDRSRSIETFLEHVGLSAAFLMLIWPYTP